jgi:hypothetical protein
MMPCSMSPRTFLKHVRVLKYLVCTFSSRYATTLMMFARVSGILSVVMRCPWTATKEERMVARVECVLHCVGRIHCFLSRDSCVRGLRS